MKPRFAMRILVLVIAIQALLSGCAGRSSPPGPSSMTGIIDGVGYVYHEWSTGLRVLMIHNTPNGLFCEGEGGTSSTTYHLECSAEALDGRTVQWEFETQDGQTADAIVAGEEFTLDQNGVFILRTTVSKSEVSFIPRDLANLVFSNDRVEAFIQSDEDLSAYLQALTTP